MGAIRTLRVRVRGGVDGVTGASGRVGLTNVQAQSATADATFGGCVRIALNRVWGHLPWAG